MTIKTLLLASQHIKDRLQPVWVLRLIPRFNQVIKAFETAFRPSQDTNTLLKARQIRQGLVAVGMGGYSVVEEPLEYITVFKY